MQLINIDLLEYSSHHCFIILKVHFEGSIADPAGRGWEKSQLGFIFMQMLEKK